MPQHSQDPVESIRAENRPSDWSLTLLGLDPDVSRRRKGGNHDEPPPFPTHRSR